MHGQPVSIFVTAVLASALLVGPSAAQTEMKPPPETVVLQVGLDRSGVGTGPIDNTAGARTDAAFHDYCTYRNVSTREAWSQLAEAAGDVFREYAITADDVAQIGRAPTDWVEASQVDRMAYESIDEVLSEKFHVSEIYLRKLNPRIAHWSGNLTGTTVRVPDVHPVVPGRKAARLEIDCVWFRLRAFDADGSLIVSFPCSIAKDPSHIPTEEMHVATFAPNPNYTFDPAVFPESPRAQAVGHKLIIPPGPNNPVGVFWLSLDRPGFGIHGTRTPRTIGRQESHGCFRLTNWDITVLSGIVDVGTPVRVVGLPQ